MSADVLMVCASPKRPGAALVRDLAAAADMVVAVDGGALALEAAGVLPDLLVGDLDSLPPESVTDLISRGVEVVTYPAHKDATDLDLALRLVRARGMDTVTVTGVSGGRLDHALAAVGALARAADLSPIVREQTITAFVMSETGRARVSVDAEGSTFSVVAPIGAAVVSVEGAVWPLAHATLEPLGDLGVSNRVSGAHASVTVHSGTVMLVVPQRA